MEEHEINLITRVFNQVLSISVSEMDVEDSVITVLTPEETVSDDPDDLIFPSHTSVVGKMEEETEMNGFLEEFPGNARLHTLSSGEQKFVGTPVTFSGCECPRSKPCGVR